MDNNEYHISPHPAYLREAKAFFALYDLVDIIMPYDHHAQLTPKQQRTCRFCRKSYPAVKFKKKAHLISESLGNKDFYSDFECDSCNDFFGRHFENDLANYLGIARTISGTEGKEGIPGFTAPGKTIKAREHSEAGKGAIIISRDDPENGSITVDKETGTLTLTAVRNSFIPIKVYKIFLKIALSLLTKETAENDYRIAIDFLMDTSGDLKLNGCLVTGYQMPFEFNLPFHAYLWKKKNNTDKTHTHVMAFYFQNTIFNLPIPMNKNDLFFYNKPDPITFFTCPPMFTQLTKVDGTRFEYFEDDFCSDEKVKGLVDMIIMKPNPEDFANTVKFDPATNQMTPGKYDPAEIMKIIIFRNNESFNVEQLSRLATDS